MHVSFEVLGGREYVRIKVDDGTTNLRPATDADRARWPAEHAELKGAPPPPRPVVAETPPLIGRPDERVAAHPESSGGKRRR